MTALEIACRRCAQQPGESCIEDGSPCDPHQERVIDAEGMGMPSANPEMVDKAIEAVVDRII